nr:NTF2-related export protein 2 isoform X3 [Dromaius novaehollandiae]
MDKRRRVLTRLYLDKATLVWNGNAVSGQEALNEFFEMLPSSEFQVNVLDCQPVHGPLRTLLNYHLFTQSATTEERPAYCKQQCKKATKIVSRVTVCCT